jgi:CRISPR-associated endonuclease/helicase Cas3
MADWIASDEGYFPYIAVDTKKWTERAKNGLNDLRLSKAWNPSDVWKSEPIFRSRFDFDPNGVQAAVLDMIKTKNSSGICVVEAPMGIGKTELALVLAEAMAQLSGRRGIYFALPSQATSDGVFPRVHKWLEKQGGPQSLRLMHAKAHLNKDFEELVNGSNIGVDEEDGSHVYVHSWFSGNKRALLDDFVVGTIDQLLMMALKQKHVMLRHLGLTNKVVIIDECHAYDAYMSTYLKRVLHWLGAYKVPVVVLSATLPVHIRQDVIDAYRHDQPKKKPSIVGWGKPPTPKESLHEDASWKTNRAYPLCTMTDGDKVVQAQLPSTEKKKNIAIDWIEDENIAHILDTLLPGGGCVGIILNTVKRAQHVANDMRMRFGEEVVTLFHSRFIACDRVEQEKKLLSELGKNTAHRPALRIVVGTQVLEQSLDIDFDVLITDICPMDLLLQRMGRLHRHERARPDPLQHPRCFVIGASQDAFDRGTKMIYGEFLLMRTKDRMPAHIVVPDDIAPLVQDVYDEDVNDPRFEEAKKKYDEHRDDKERKAKSFRLTSTNTEFDSCLDVTLSDHVGQAAVRDTREGFEVLLVQKKSDGYYYFLPWVQNGDRIFHGSTGCDWEKELAKCSVRLPEAVCGYDQKQLEQTEQCILEQMKPIVQWTQQSHWLRHELVLTMDEHFVTFIKDYRICYNKADGLTYTKWEGGERHYGAE